MFFAKLKFELSTPENPTFSCYNWFLFTCPFCFFWRGFGVQNNEKEQKKTTIKTLIKNLNFIKFFSTIFDKCFNKQSANCNQNLVNIKLSINFV